MNLLILLLIFRYSRDLTLFILLFIDYLKSVITFFIIKIITIRRITN